MVRIYSISVYARFRLGLELSKKKNILHSRTIGTARIGRAYLVRRIFGTRAYFLRHTTRISFTPAAAHIFCGTRRAYLFLLCGIIRNIYIGACTRQYHLKFSALKFSLTAHHSLSLTHSRIFSTRAQNSSSLSRLRIFDQLTQFSSSSSSHNSTALSIKLNIPAFTISA